MLQGRRVVLGVCGSVAAYKAALLARELGRRGARVRTILTPAATAFITPLLMESLTGEPAAAALFEGSAGDGRRGGGDLARAVPGGGGSPAAVHVAWATWAEAGVVAPATADLLAKLAAGIADDLLSTWLLAFPGPVVLAPAMNRHMWEHPAVRRSVDRVRADGYRVVAPGFGALAAGEAVGWGRLAEPEEIVGALEGVLAAGRGASRGAVAEGSGPAPAGGAPPPAAGSRLLDGRRVLVTAGPTREPLDPVRFLSNRSSGRMGYALAEAARDMGAAVTLVSGPVALPPPPGVCLRRVTTALEMRAAVQAAVAEADLVVFAAAVADWRPAEVAGEKRKRGEAAELVLRLVPNPDISAEVGAHKGRRVLVGFAAEAGAGPEEAERKLRSKGLDLVAFNDVREPGAGFEVDTNRVVLVDGRGGREEIGPASKRAVAERILVRAAALLPAPAPGGPPAVS